MLISATHPTIHRSCVCSTKQPFTMIHARAPTYHDASQRHICEATTWAIPSVAKVGGNGIVDPVHMLLFKLLRILLPQSPADKPSITHSQTAAATAVGAARVHAGACQRRGVRWRERPYWMPARCNQSVACRAAAAGLRHSGESAAGTRNQDGGDRERQEQAAQRPQKPRPQKPSRGRNGCKTNVKAAARTGQYVHIVLSARTSPGDGGSVHTHIMLHDFMLRDPSLTLSLSHTHTLSLQKDRAGGCGSGAKCAAPTGYHGACTRVHMGVRLRESWKRNVCAHAEADAVCAQGWSRQLEGGASRDLLKSFMRYCFSRPCRLTRANKTRCAFSRQKSNDGQPYVQTPCGRTSTVRAHITHVYRCYRAARRPETTRWRAMPVLLPASLPRHQARQRSAPGGGRRR
jgi:hypothetical protein